MRLNIQLFADTEVSIKFNNKVTGENKLQKYAQTLAQINSVLSGLNTGVTKQLESSATSVNAMGDDISKIKKNVGLAFNYAVISKSVSAIKKLGAGFSSLAKQSFDYLENFNLFQVAFNGNYNSAERFINKMAEMYGLDESWLTQTVGKFKQLSNAMGMTAETGEKVSKLLTQMSLDISSLYNVDIDRAASTLSSAMAGQTKPIRGVAGADITQTTLQTTLDQLGIDNTVNKLSFAEKRLLIIISLTRQLNASIGDMGRTIESPSNQLRIMNEQWERLSRAVGNVFLPILSKILPYLNAILMVLTEIISTFATFLGFSTGDFDYFESATSGVEDLDTGLKSAGASAKKLKQGLRGFDKLNVITTPSTGGSGGGAGGVGGVNPKLLDAFNKAFDDYQKKLSNIKMEATKIRDRIMEWLGFSKEIDPITGKTYFKYQGIRTTLKNMWESFKGLSAEGKILVGLGIVVLFRNLWKIGKLLLGVIGKSGLGKALIGLVAPLKGIVGYIKVYKSLSGSLIGGIKGGTDAWSKQLGVLDKLKITMLGAGGIYVGLKLLNSGLKDVAKEGEVTTGSFLKLAGGIGTTIASGALIGSQFGAWGAVIGGVAGAVISLYDAFMNYPTAVSIAAESINEAAEGVSKFNTSLKEQYDTIKNNAQQQTAIQDSYSSLVDELENIVDANGRIKKGYEERAEFIVTTLNKAYGLEIEIVNGKIKNYKKELSAIKSIIREKRKQIALESAEEGYKVALENKVPTYQNLVKAEKNYTKAVELEKQAQDKANKAQEDWNHVVSGDWGTYSSYQMETFRQAVEKANNELELAQEATANAKGALDGATSAYDANTEAILTYEGLLTADTKENAELVDKYVKQIENSYYNGKENLKLTYQEQEDDALRYYTSVLRTTKDNEEAITNEVLKNAESKLTSLKTNLAEMTTTLEGEMGDSLIDAWGTLSQSSESEFINKFKQLPSDLQQQVVDKMQDKGYDISQELQNGINKLNPTINVKGNTSGLRTSIDNFFKKNSSIFEKIGLSIPALKLAGGGLPPVGQMFIANEKGPELVGHIGGQSFVANQNQVVDLLDRKLGEAKTNPINATFVIQVGNKEIAKQVITDLQDMAKTNGKSITIGG